MTFSMSKLISANFLITLDKKPLLFELSLRKKRIDRSRNLNSISPRNTPKLSAQLENSSPVESQWKKLRLWNNFCLEICLNRARNRLFRAGNTFSKRWNNSRKSFDSWDAIVFENNKREYRLEMRFEMQIPINP